jgi:hypothetical protein
MQMLADGVLVIVGLAHVHVNWLLHPQLSSFCTKAISPVVKLDM